MRRLQIVNSFFHDMSTGTWAACVLVIVLLNLRRLDATGEVAIALLEAQWAVFWLMLIALVVLALTGGLYLRYSKDKAATPKDLAVRRRLLIQKHIILLTIYGIGTVWMWLLLRS
ncbi:MAG: hypothetical protein FWE87_06270 [Coriobacteriia bacterium]|nr:hypothetical protein [Coriobacteriia bacterium]